MSLVELYNKDCIKSILRKTHEVRCKMADIDFILSDITDTEKALEEAKKTYEDAKIQLTDIKNVLDSMMID